MFWLLHFGFISTKQVGQRGAFVLAGIKVLVEFYDITFAQKKLKLSL
jgi:hypothetical protein